MYKRNNIKKQGYCLICFKNLNEEVSLVNLFTLNNCICENCLNKFKDINIHTHIDGVEMYVLYEYNDFLKSLLYQFKGCYDIAFSKVFLYKYKRFINKKYKGYLVIYPPSSDVDNKKRGYNHIKEIISLLKLKNDDLFFKKETYKQSDQKYADKEKIKNIIKLKKSKKITNQKYLIVDDVYTSGNTIKTIINILIENKVDKNNIKVLVLSKRSDFVEL